MNNKLKKWEIEALKAIDIAFDKNGKIKENLIHTDKIKAKGTLYHCINNLKPDLAWPYIKLVDLIDDDKEKIRLHAQAYLIENNIYSIKYLFEKIIKDNPDILNNYL